MRVIVVAKQIVLLASLAGCNGAVLAEYFCTKFAGVFLKTDAALRFHFVVPGSTDQGTSILFFRGSLLGLPLDKPMRSFHEIGGS
jgi:hypothetical protein